MASSATLQSNSLEGQLLELISKIQNLEGNAETNPDNLNRVTGSFNQDTGVYSGSFSIPCSSFVNAQGMPTFAAMTYLLDLAS